MFKIDFVKVLIAVTLKSCVWLYRIEDSITVILKIELHLFYITKTLKVGSCWGGFSCSPGKDVMLFGVLHRPALAPVYRTLGPGKRKWERLRSALLFLLLFIKTIKGFQNNGTDFPLNFTDQFCVTLSQCDTKEPKASMSLWAHGNCPHADRERKECVYVWSR